MPERLSKKVVGNTLFITLNLSRLDANSATSLKNELKLDLDSTVDNAEIELGQVEFIDSSGVGCLLGIYRKLPGNNATVTLLNVRPAVQMVLELLRLHRVFKIA